MVMVSLILSGCGMVYKNSSEILLDLTEKTNFSEKINKNFSVLSEYSDNDEYEISCDIINVADFKERDVYECNIKCYNSDFESSYIIRVTYTSSDEAEGPEYKIIQCSDTVISAIADDYIVSFIEQHFDQDNITVNVDKSTIVKEMDGDGSHLEVSASGTVTQGILTKECEFDVTCIFIDEWNIYVDYETVSYDWDIKALEGKKWICTEGLDKGDFAYIESVDEENCTLMMGYSIGFYVSSFGGPVEEYGKPVECTYSCDEDCINISTDRFDLQIEPDMSTVMSGYPTYPSN